jgi:hypothetical protein
MGSASVGILVLGISDYDSDTVVALAIAPEIKRGKAWKSRVGTIWSGRDEDEVENIVPVYLTLKE